MGRKELAICVGFFYFLSSGTLGADLIYYRDGERNISEYEGEIQKGDLEKFESILRSHEYITEVRLSSPGGLIYEAFEISKFLRNNNIASRVSKGKNCFSACFDIFIGGIIRSIEAGAKLGSHMHSLPIDTLVSEMRKKYDKIKDKRLLFYLIVKDTEQQSALATAKRFKNLIDMGVDYRALNPLIATHTLREYYFDRHEMEYFNIINSD